MSCGRSVLRRRGRVERGEGIVRGGLEDDEIALIVLRELVMVLVPVRLRLRCEEGGEARGEEEGEVTRCALGVSWEA